jgi:hypothetical protein
VNHASRSDGVVSFSVGSSVRRARSVPTKSRLRVPQGKAWRVGPHPSADSYGTFASFSDPDGNEWVLQQIVTRAPGR